MKAPLAIAQWHLVLALVVLTAGCVSSPSPTRTAQPAQPVAAPREPANDKAATFATALQAGDLNTVNQMLDSGTVDVNFRFNPRSNNSQRSGSSFAWTWIAIDEKTMDNAFPLFVAAENGRTEVVNALLTRGADVNLRTKYGATALFIAAQEGHTEIVTSLLAKGADLTTQTNGGWNALMVASYKGWDEVARALVKGGAKPNDKGSAAGGEMQMTGGGMSMGRVQVTPLYIACLAGNAKVVAALVECGADPNVTMSDGKTALDAANAVKHAEVIEILTKAGARTGASSQ